MAQAPDGRGRATWWGWCLWLPACVAFAALLAWASFEIAEHGLLGVNARIRPADPVLRDLHPELIKWAQ